MKCNICLSSIDKKASNMIDYPSINEDVSGIEIPSDILICKSCDVGMAEPMLDQDSINIIYNDSIYWSESLQVKISKKNYPTAFSLAASRWTLIKDYLKKDSEIEILDIGSGLGCLGISALEDDLVSVSKYVAVDSDRNILKMLSTYWSENNNSAELNILEDIDQYSGKADIVVLSHVLEHVEDPFLFLSKIKTKIKVGGLLFIDVPNRDYLFKKDVFPHLYFFSLKSLEVLSDRLGLENLDVDGWGRSYTTNPLNDKLKSLLSYLNLLLERFFAKIIFVANDNFHVIFYKWFFGANKRNKNGTWIRLVARKNP